MATDDKKRTNDGFDNDDSDLYGDLDHAQPATAAASRKEDKATEDSRNPKRHKASDKPKIAVRSLVQEVEFLQNRVQQLQEENEILKRNMGTLYRTAVAELKRKNDEIQRLYE